jgi:putative DNA primase/helicase
VSRRAFDLDEPYVAREITNRDPDGVLARAVTSTNVERPFGWHSLEWIALTDKRDAIRIYERLGLSPILVHGTLDDGACTCGKRPCGTNNRNAGKHPVEMEWQLAPVDVDHLDAALERNWRFNIGLRMGLQPNGLRLVALDVDGPLSLLANLEAKNGKLPATLTSKSARGYHLIFRVPTAAMVPNAVKLDTNVDVRSEGGMIVAAPSRHLSGAKYTWLDCQAPEALF